MGTLGQYLRDARVAKGIDLRDAAQQTRISFNYLKALESEDFTKLPGEVFVKGFLKNYSRFLNLDEAEIMKRYAELKPKTESAHETLPEEERAAAIVEPGPVKREMPIEPFVWGAVIVLALAVFLFTSLPVNHSVGTQPHAPSPALPQSDITGTQGMKPEKLYLEVTAAEDTWLLVRTDASPQKKAVLKKGDTLTWSADERFLLSYGRLGAVKLKLNGQDLEVTGAKESVVRELLITRSGIANLSLPPSQPKAKLATQQTQSALRQSQTPTLTRPVTPRKRTSPEGTLLTSPSKTTGTAVTRSTSTASPQ